MKVSQAFVDMDGVLARFFEDAIWVNTDSNLPHSVRTKQYRAALAEYPKGEYQIERYLGISTDDFWSEIDAKGERFWRELLPCDGAMDLWAIVQPLNPIVLTSPSMQPHCVSGKLQWLQRHFGSDVRDYIFCPAQHKKHLAAEGRLLIDDRPSNVTEWIDAGGIGYLWPHLGNDSQLTIADALNDIRVLVDAQVAA